MKAFYAGTFDPITRGHMHIILRAHRLAPEGLVIGVANNPDKQPTFDLHQRMTWVETACAPYFHAGELDVLAYRTLTVEAAKHAKCEAMIRGLRAVSDFDYEAMIATANADLNSEIETVFLMASPKYAYISSSLVRNIARHGAADVKLDHLVPECVLDGLREHYLR